MMAATSGSSIVPSTCEWLERICSTSVEPARGSPTMKMGSGVGRPGAGTTREEVGGEQCARALDARRGPLGVVLDRGPAQPVALGVVPEGRVEVARVLERLASCEVEVIAVLAGEIAARELPLHAGDLVRGEPEGFRFARLHQASPKPGQSSMVLR